MNIDNVSHTFKNKKNEGIYLNFDSSDASFNFYNEVSGATIKLLFDRGAFNAAKENIAKGSEDGYSIVIMNTLTTYVERGIFNKTNHALALDSLGYIYNKPDALMQYYTLIDPILRQFTNVN